MQLKKLLTQRCFLYSVALTLRIFLLVYGAWQDNTLTVKYTDIDYKVLSDGALHVTEGKSPFNRLTYRYTPLMAYLLVPNHLLTSMWGKFLFMSMDMFVAYWIDRILSLQFEVAGFPNISENQKMARSLNGGEYQTETRSHVMKYVCLWMFNPFTANVSTRGNAESVVALFVVLSLYLLFRGKLFLGSVVYGVAVHFKIYPILYSLPLFLWIAHSDVSRHTKTSEQTWWRRLFWFITPRSVFFGCVSGSVLTLLTWGVYWMYGWEALYEAYLFHFFRKDNRHNFSIYFYYIYLSTAFDTLPSLSPLARVRMSTSLTELVPSLISFVPQFCLFLAIAWKYYKHITFCIFLQTIVFVVFNKVCTVQYFIWFFSLLPLALPYLKPSSTWHLALLSLLWFGSQGLWLYFAYRLEFLGENKFLEIWLASLLYFLINVMFIVKIIHWFRPLLPSKQKNE